MLYKRRKEQAEMVRREAAGESFFSGDFPDRTRVRLLHVIEQHFGRDMYPLFREARALILRDEGLRNLAGETDVVRDFDIFFQQCETEDFASALEAVLRAAEDIALGRWDTSYATWSEFTGLMQDVTAVLREDRIAWELTPRGEMLPFESKELFTSVVEPTLTLLGPKPGWKAVETAYQHSLEELSKRGGKPGDAITDAGTALQEALKAAGAEGNALGPLITSARKDGLLGRHDSVMTDGIQKVMNWVSAERSESGDSHKVSDATAEDAWLMVHVVGALIVWLARRT